jgi:hypothetical protein
MCTFLVCALGDLKEIKTGEPEDSEFKMNSVDIPSASF